MHECVLDHYVHTYYDLPSFIKIGRMVVKYGDLTVVKMAAVSHLGFVKFNFFDGLGG